VTGTPHATDTERDRIVGLAPGSLEETIYAAAGAGTGKTQALVERIANLIVISGVNPENIAAVTFTVAAASELRQRVREELERRYAGHVDAAENREATAISRALDSLDSAFIGTIHSFAQSLLRERPLSVGLPPVFDLYDGVQGDTRLDEEWSEWLDESLGQKEFADAVVNAQRLGLRQPLTSLRELAEELHANYDLVERLGLLPAPTQTDSPRIVLESIRSDLAAALDLRGNCTNPDDKLLAHLNSVVDQSVRWIDEAVASESDQENVLALTQIAKLTVGGGRKDDWLDLVSGDSSIEEVRALLGGAQERLEAGRESLGEATVIPLFNAVSQMVLKYAQRRRTEGLLEYQDLLVLSSELLDSDDEVRRYFQQRYTHVLIDEFQDTDPLQLKLAMKLADRSDGSSGGGTPTPGALFVVGDEKQSIYRFRRADLTQLNSLIHLLDAEPLSLRDNYRSNPEILSWVNAIFDPWMNGADGSSPDPNQASYVALEPGRDDYSESELPRVMVIGGAADGTIDVAREAESQDLAQLAISVGSGAWSLPDGAGGFRDSDYRDLCILMPRRTALSYLENAFIEHDVPYVLEGQAPVFDSQTVHELSNNLVAIDDPTDQVAIVGALKSAAWGCSDQDLYEWASAGLKFEYARNSVDPTEFTERSGARRIADALAGLAEFHEKRHQLSTPSLIELFLRMRRLREVAALANSEGDRERLMDLLIEMSRSLQRSGNGSLREFVRWISKQGEARVRVAEGALSNSDVNAVRVMTIHAAKGLEFPIVALMGLQVNASAPRGSSIIKEELGEPVIGAKLGSVKLGIATANYRRMADASKDADSSEQVRLAYVGATRAREHLIVSVHRSSRDKATLAAKIGELDEQNELSHGISRLPVVDSGSNTNADYEGSPGAEPYSLERRSEWIAEFEQAVDAASYRGYVTPSGLADHSMFDAPKPEDNFESVEWNTARRGRGGTKVGSAVHEVLQDIDLADHSNLDQLVRLATDAFAIPELSDDVALLVRNVLESPSMTGLSADNSWREAWVAAEVAEGIEVEGYVDLMIQHDDGSITIVDFKTDQVVGELLDERARGYENQLAGYALVLEKLGLTVRNALLIFADGDSDGRAYEYFVEDLEQAKTAAMAKIRSEISGRIRVTAP
jgi:ATP-dependent exoDNAse (exonuclease V) beta subunit